MQCAFASTVLSNNDGRCGINTHSEAVLHACAVQRTQDELCCAWQLIRLHIAASMHMCVSQDTTLHRDCGKLLCQCDQTAKLTCGAVAMRMFIIYAMLLYTDVDADEYNEIVH